MDENTNIVQEILHDLFSAMEALETQNTAILQFLKDKGIATDEELASRLEQAGNASSVRWRGVRVRADYLFASAIKAAEQAAQKESPKPAETEQESKPAAKKLGGKETAKGAQPVANQNAATDQPKNDQRDNVQPDNVQPDDHQPENGQPKNDKPEADEASARVEQKAEQKPEQNAEQNAEGDIEQDVKHDRNQRDDSDNRPRKKDTEKAA
jgi:hypothetical protein